MRDDEETLKKVLGESAEEALREMKAEGVAARARKAEAVPNKKEVGSTIWIMWYLFRSWCPH